MRCVTLSQSGSGYILQASDDVAECAPNQLVLVSYGEFLALPRSPFVMSVGDGAYISGLIISVWVSAFLFRSLVRVVRDKGDDD